MEEKKIIYQIILDIWGLIKKYVLQPPLDDDGWEQFINEAKSVSNNYKAYDKNIQTLFSEIFHAVEKYKASRDRKDGAGC